MPLIGFCMVSPFLFELSILSTCFRWRNSFGSRSVREIFVCVSQEICVSQEKGLYYVDA
jgi:hypothetical protein